MKRSIAAPIALVWLASVTTGAAQTPRDLSLLSMEDLVTLQVEQVFGAADRIQPVTEVPSSVTVITAEEIARYGYRTLGDVLASVRGFYVTNDRNYSYVGARGFNRPGDYSTRVLLLVNGRRMNDSVYDQASVGAEFGIDAAMFQRVEVIRGPASSLYGTNALFAIINVVTRTGASLDGVSLNVDGGSLGSRLTRAAFGRKYANGVDVALSGTVEHSRGVERLYVPAFDVDGSNGGFAEGLDGERSRQVYGRFSASDLTMTGFAGRRTKDVPTASFFTVFNAHDPAEQTADQRAMISAQYARTVGATRLRAESSIDHYRYDGVYPYDGDNGGVVSYEDGASGLRWSFSSRATRMFRGHQTLTAGGDFVNNVRETQWGGYSFESADNFRAEQSGLEGALYLQDEVRLRSWLVVNGGLRHDRWSGFNRTTPRGAIIAMPTPNHSLKYLYGRAFRAPNAYELYYYRDASVSLRPESIDTHEWVWEGYFGERLRTSVSTYRYRASQLIDLKIVDAAVDPEDGLGFVNAGTTRAAGLELESEVRLKSGAQGLASYAWQHANSDELGGARLTNSPRHMAKAKLSVPGPRQDAFASVEWQYLSRRTTVAGTTVAPAVVAHVTGAWPLRRAMLLQVQLRNLFDATYFDPASEEHLADAIEQNGRTVRVGVQWKLWNK